MRGSFQSEDKQHWIIFLGKYEITRAQYALVMGDGDMEKGIQYLTSRSANEAELIEKLINEPDKAKREKDLAKPVSGLTYDDYRTFIHRLNNWCSQDWGCTAALPRFDACLKPNPELQKSRADLKQRNTGIIPGFFRLPTEAEWEFTARLDENFRALARSPPSVVSSAWCC